MVFQGYDVSQVLENSLPSPVRSLGKAGFAGLSAIPVLILGMVIWPLYPLYFIAVIMVAASVSSWALWQYYDAKRDEPQLVKDRKFVIDGYPKHPEDLAALAYDERYGFGTKVHTWRSALGSLPVIGNKVRYVQKGRYWFMPGPPCTRVKVKETVFHENGSMTQRSMYRRRGVPEHQAAVDRIRDHLRKRHPAVFATVVEWWERHVRAKTVGQIYPGKTWEQLDKKQQKDIIEKVSVELNQGVHVALRPETWTVKYDKRPTHRHLSELREVLKQLYMREGEYPNKEKLKSVPWIRQQRCKWMYVGKGARWAGKHAAKYYYEKFRDPDQIKAKRDETADGDTRFFGIIWREQKDVFLEFDLFKQHCLVLGGPGLGKTRGVESLMIAGITNCSATMVMDPKIDKRLLNLAMHYARLVGREDDFQSINLGDPENPYNCSFSPLAGVIQPIEYGSRMGAILPESGGDNQFFTDEAKRVARIALSVCFWINEWLGTLSGGDVTSHRPPKLLLWMTYCRSLGIDGTKGSAIIEKAKADFEIIHSRLWKEGSLFVPRTDVEKNLQKVWNNERYGAGYWIPSYNHALWYAAQKPWRLVSWGIRLVHWHILADIPDWSDYEWPERDSRDLVIGPHFKSDGAADKPTVLKAFEKMTTHPLDAASGRENREYIKKWGPVYEAMIPRDKVVEIRRILREFTALFNEQISSASTDPETYKKHSGTLDSPISLITSGSKGRLLCDQNPDITMSRIHLEKKIVVFDTDVQGDRDTALAVCKSLSQSILTYGGKQNVRGGGDMDLVVVSDEMASWATEDWAQVIDKQRANGLRTANMSQSMAGFRAAIKNEDMVKHMYACFYTTMQFGSQSKEDSENFVEKLGSVLFYVPERSINESPSFGDASSRNFGTSENWNLRPQELPIIDKDALPKMPKGQCWIYQGGNLWLVQVGYLRDPETNYMAEQGMDDNDQECEIDGIDFDTHHVVGPDVSWGSSASLDQAKVTAETGLVSGDDIDNEEIPCPPSRQEVEVELPPSQNDGPDGSQEPREGGDKALDPDLQEKLARIRNVQVATSLLASPKTPKAAS